MKLKPILIAGVMVLCAGAAIFGLAKLHTGSSGDDEGTGSDEKTTPVITVETGALQRTTLHSYVSGYGTVEPAPATADEPAAGGTLSSPSAGVVAKVDVIVGQPVKQGDVLVELNSGTTSFAYAEAEVERQKKLFANQNTSLKNLQDAEAQFAALRIVSPVSGTVTRLPAKPGMAVDANTVVAEVIDLSRLAVSAQIPAADAKALRTNEEVQLSTTPPVTTSLSFVSPAVEANDGTVLTRARLPADSGLRPGQFVPLKIVTAVRSNCLAAPAESVVTGQDGKSFVALVKGDEAAQVPVTTGLRENGWVEIEGKDLKAGDPIVTVGAYGFPEKAKIRAANAPTDEPTNSVTAQ